MADGKKRITMYVQCMFPYVSGQNRWGYLIFFSHSNSLTKNQNTCTLIIEKFNQSDTTAFENVSIFEKRERSNYQILIEMFYLLKGVWRQLQTTNNKTVFDSNNFSTFPFQSSAKLTFPRVVTLNSSLVLFKIMSYQVHSRNTNKDFYKLLHQGKISTMWNEIVRVHRSAKTEMATKPKRDCHGSSHINRVDSVNHSCG